MSCLCKILTNATLKFEDIIQSLVGSCKNFVRTMEIFELSFTWRYTRLGSSDGKRSIFYYCICVGEDHILWKSKKNRI